MSRKLTAISLFSGLGGLDFGLDRAGFATLGSVELDPAAREQLGKHRKSANLLDHGDVCTLSSRELLSAVGKHPTEIDLLAAGPPCQPFSRAGAWFRAPRGLRDPRADTLRSFFRILRGVLPRAVLLENVPGLVNRHGRWLATNLASVNRACGTAYSFTAISVNAADYGVPQTRRRYFLLANRYGLPFQVPEPTHGPGRQQAYLTSWDALGGLKIDSELPELRPRGRWAGLLPTIPEGSNYLFHTDRGGGLPIFGWRRRYWTFLLKLAKDLPSWTIAANPGPGQGPFHWDNRRLSIQELLALQTIPIDCGLHLPLPTAQRLIGNAVPSAIGEMLGRAIREQWFGGRRDTKPLSLLPARKRRCPAAGPVLLASLDWIGSSTTTREHPGPGLGPGVLKERRAR